MDRMNVGLAVVVVDDSAIQELKVSVNLAWIPAQAVEQVIKSRMTRIFILGLQGRESWPHRVGLNLFGSRKNLSIQRIMSYYEF